MSSQDQSNTLGYQPALDGVRAVAVVMVLFFHAGFGWMGGGYLGVSIFFTLSGFLITSLLLVESDRTGRVSFGRFYSRRLKRLLPASLLCIGGIVVAYWLGHFSLVAGMRDQMWGALADVYNWVRISGSSSYADLFGGAPGLMSPLEHYWSLAIEEQFYVVWPLTAWILIRHCRRRGTSVVRAMFVLTVACAVAAPLITTLSSSKFGYWSTPTRLGELLMGATAAAWHHRGGRLPLSSRWLGLGAVGVLVVLASRLPVGSGPAYTGWMAPIAFVSAALILSLQVPGVLRSALSLPAVVWVGRVSYGVYLFHWPVFVLLRTHGWQLGRPLGLAVALSITLSISAVSFYFVEQPIRGATWKPRRTFIAATTAAIVVATAIVVAPVHRGFLELNQQTLDQAAIQPLGPAGSLVPLTPTTTSVADAVPSTSLSTTTTLAAEPLEIALPTLPSRPVRILMVGDSTALLVAEGLAGWIVANPGYAQLDILWCPGCGFLRGGTITSYDGAEKRSAVMIGEELPKRVRKLTPDVVVLMTTIDDIANRQWSESEGPLTPRDAAFRVRMRQSYSHLTAELLAMGVPLVVWVVPPVPHAVAPTPDLGDLARYEVQHEVIRNVVANDADGVSLVDLDQWMVRAGHQDDDAWRPDGIHFSEQSAEQLATTYLGPRLLLVALGT